MPRSPEIRTEAELAAIARALSNRRALQTTTPHLEQLRRSITAGADPLGEAYCALRTPAERRPTGAVYTPPALVSAMLERAAASGTPERVIDAGTGSGRFLLAAARQFPNAKLIAVETDPLALAILRANITVNRLTARTTILSDDYRTLKLPATRGKTLYIGNPPYVRHHQIPPRMKQWLTARAAELGHKASQLAGLHAHFLLATAHHARAGDTGVLILPAEWLDIRYGALMRDLLTGPLGLTDLHLLEPSARAFENTDTTAIIIAFEVGTRTPTITHRTARTIADLTPLTGGTPIPREHLTRAPRWTPHLRTTPGARPGARAHDKNTPELGEYFHVHRGQVTGNNSIWIAGPHSADLPPSVLYPSITRARELIRAGTTLTTLTDLRAVIDLPADLDTLPPADRRAVERFLTEARRRGAHQSYIARHRKTWWTVALRPPAPLLVTYMARRPPAFVHNLAGARHLNIAHGLYPRAPLAPTTLAAIARHLSLYTPQSGGRTYAGGLTKFEPGEVQRLRVRGVAEILGVG